MKNVITLAKDALLAPAQLDEGALESVLGIAMNRSVDSADLFLQCSYEENWVMEDGLVKDGAFSIDRGFGLRTISGEKVGFAYADEINLKALEQAAASASGIVSGGEHKSIQMARHVDCAALYPHINPLDSLLAEEKINLLKKIDQTARARDPRIKQVIASLSASYDIVLIIDTDGRLAADVRPLVGLSLKVLAEEKGRREQGSSGGGRRSAYDYLMDEALIQGYVDKAVNQSLINLEAVPAPAGTMPVVLGPGWPAVLLHEAVGHGLEGDFNRKGSSAFSGRVGERVASTLCTIVDDGTLAGRRGSLSLDDEGTPTQNTVLIKKGILKNYMQDRHNAALMGTVSTGNGRRESYACLPLPRMTNTYMLPGESDPEEIIASVDHGLYAVDFAGGQVDITSGSFVFSASEAYLIENGKVVHPVKGATLVGNGPEVLTRVSMVGNDLALDSGIGTCGKSGQSVPVGVGQPTLKVDHLTVGGEQSSD